MPVVGKEKREAMEAQFNVKNTELMRRLHPKLAQEQLVRPRIGQRSIRADKTIVEVKVESDEEDSDIQIVSDDECKVIETSRPPIKRKKNFKDYQHEIPGKKSKESDIIDLASSDEEEI